MDETAAGLYQLLHGEAPDAPPNPSLAELSRHLAATLSNRPMVRVAVRPGEAYLAPTENLLHDSSTEGQSRLDLTVTFRGRLALPLG